MDYSKMTDDELRIKIAEAKGWRHKSRNVWINPIGFEDTPKDWPYEIADAWELESEIADAVEQWSYTNELIRIVYSTLLVDRCQSFAFAHATPRQRCEAWLSWKEAANSHSPALSPL